MTQREDSSKRVPHALIGTQLGPYEIIALLGSGGMGDVYRARDRRLDRSVAIKILRDQFTSRFDREARAVAALNHPNVCSLYDIGPNYLVMEFVEGDSLAGHLRNGPLDKDAVLQYGIQIAEALAAAHARGIVHRDLKPENILITLDGRVKLMDFGLALMRSAFTAANSTLETFGAAITQPGTVLGTFPYMSPEQVRGESLESTSDIFSLGSLLYEAMSGRRAFARPSAAETIAAILTEEPAQLHGQVEFERIVRRCLAKNPGQRFATAKEVGAALAQLRDGHALPAQTPAPGADTLAVLPFVNAAGDEDTEYLCEGIAETLINHLSQVSALRVVARTSAFRYRGESDLQKIARSLGVSAVLSGKLAKRGDSLNVQVELVDPRSATQLWGQRYQRKLTDIFVLEEDIAREIIGALRPRLLPHGSERLSRDSNGNVDAYKLCLKGRFFWNKRTRQALERAIACYRDAIELEPTYALAYAGLADCYNVLGTFAVLPPGVVFPRARAAAQRALDIDDDLVPARVALATISAFYDRDSTASDREFRQAITMNPQYAEARQWYGHHLCVRGHFDDGLRELQQAQALDPLSPMLNAQLASGYYFARRYERATEILRTTIEIDGRFGPAHWFLGKVYAQLGDLDRAAAELQAAVDATGGPIFLATLGWLLGVSGRLDEAERVLDELRSRAAGDYVSPICFGLVHAGLGDRPMTVERLRQAIEERSPFAIWMKVDPLFDQFRGDPGFEALLRSLD